MKKLLVLAVLAAAAYALFAFVLRPPEKWACLRAAELCGLDPRGGETNRCIQMLDSLKTSSGSSVEQVTTCMVDAKSCGGVAGCASGGALTAGVGFATDFFNGLLKSMK